MSSEHNNRKTHFFSMEKQYQCLIDKWSDKGCGVKQRVAFSWRLFLFAFQALIPLSSRISGTQTGYS